MVAKMKTMTAAKVPGRGKKVDPWGILGEKAGHGMREIPSGIEPMTVKKIED